MDSPYGWNWDGVRWTFREIPVDIWSPMREQEASDGVARKYKAWAESPEGKLCDKFIAHWGKCRKCKGKALSALCPVGERWWAKLAPRHRAWCGQLQEAAQVGQEARILYRV